MFSIKKTLVAISAIALFGISFTSCTNDSVADQDELYNDHQAIDKSRITKETMPTNG